MTVHKLFTGCFFILSMLFFIISVSMDTLSDNAVTVYVTAASVEDPSVSDTLEIAVEKKYYRVTDIHGGAGDADPFYGMEYNGKFMFAADDNVHGNELWVCNE